MKSIKDWAILYLTIFLFIVFYFIFNGLVTVPWEGDSLAYHIPIAKNILLGKFSNFESLLYYYPASVHVLLAVMMGLGLPLQLFNVIGILFLFSSLFFLGRRFNLDKNYSVIFAVVISTLTPMMRLINTQTVDIYLAGFYSLLLALLLNPEKKLSYFINLGLIGGMLIGSKFTGPLFSLLLLPFFLKQVLQKIKLSWFITFTILVISVGGIWYLRNLFLMGDLFYPANHPDFTWVKWHTWQTILQKEGGVLYFLESIFSEYLIWTLSLLAVPYLLLKKKLNNLEIKIALIGIGNFIMHLLIPASPDNVLSDMRYTVPTFICLLLVIFSYAKRKNKRVELAIVSMIPLLSSFTLVVPHRPKLFVLFSMVSLIVWVFLKYFNKKKA
jgi:hypothetical protein